ncbi:MAG TPA: YhcN/YlaJ family sporulation lipoprotein [Bacillota bacterium]|nr:YhcN/YlaJ family sporulation lipoprotein [Bacillota bacterium]
MKYIMPWFLFFLLLMGCSTNGNDAYPNQEKPHTKPIRYETDGERNKRMGQDNAQEYPKYRHRGPGAGQKERNYSDIFTNEESEQISERVMNYEEVNLAQTASMDDRVVVAVMFNEYHDSDDQIIADIRQEVETIVPEKDVVIYTDDKYWDHMRDINAGKDRSGVEQYINRYLENFFKTE